MAEININICFETPSRGVARGKLASMASSTGKLGSRKTEVLPPSRGETALMDILAMLSVS